MAAHGYIRQEHRRLPTPVLSGTDLSLTFHAIRPDLTYTVETSTNLTQWTTTGVTQTAPGADGHSTASVLRDAPQRFLRLMVEDLGATREKASPTTSARLG